MLNAQQIENLIEHEQEKLLEKSNDDVASLIIKHAIAVLELVLNG